MCTLTWWSSPNRCGDYEVFFNRDELKTREVATPPVEGEMNGVRFLAPRDGAAGGTWLLVNELGVTLALLNWYSRENSNATGKERISRGKLVMELGDSDSPESLKRRLSEFTPGQFQPFRLIGFFPGVSAPRIDYWQWSGSGALENRACPPMPICSSSFDRSAVITRREACLREALAAGGGPEVLWDYHHGTAGEPGSAYTVRMNRPDAQTWSISRITVDSDMVRFFYEAEQWNHAGPPEPSVSDLDRKRS